MSKQNFKLFLRDGKWYGNYFPSETKKTCGGKGFCCDGRRCEALQWEEDVETAKSTALEIVNSEVAITPSLQGGLWIHREGNKYDKVVPGDLYDWDGEVKRLKKFDTKDFYQVDHHRDYSEVFASLQKKCARITKPKRNGYASILDTKPFTNTVHRKSPVT